MKQFRITTPANGQALCELSTLCGNGHPNVRVTIRLDKGLPASVMSDANGFWRIDGPFSLPDGRYGVTASQWVNGYCFHDKIHVEIQSSACAPKPPALLTPADGSVVKTRNPAISGNAEPENVVTISLSGHEPWHTAAGLNGVFSTCAPGLLDPGDYTVSATQTSLDTGVMSAAATKTFTVSADLPVPPPTVDTPVNDAAVADPVPAITGRGIPGHSVRLCFDNSAGYKTAVVDKNGRYAIRAAEDLLEGEHILTAVQADAFGNQSAEATTRFRVDTTAFRFELVSVQSGPDFRSVEIEYALAGDPGELTVYYLLLPPGSQAPTASEMMGSLSEDQLLNGTAARGRFAQRVSSARKVHTRRLTGRDAGVLLPGEPGVIDGYYYDMYLYAVTPEGISSGVLSGGKAVMGMPFAGGNGTMENPYIIRSMTAAELQNYPDLEAGHALNPTGVDRVAKMLENIECMAALCDDTGGACGMPDALDLDYRLVSDIDLSGYADAYNGAGWVPIGNVGEGRETSAGMSGLHIFTGSFDGANHTISGLRMRCTCDPAHPARLAGLFGRASVALVENLTVSKAYIHAGAAFRCEEGNAKGEMIGISALCGRADNCFFKKISIAGFTVDLDAGRAGGLVFGCGGIAGIAKESMTAEDIAVEDAQLNGCPGRCFTGGLIGVLEEVSAKAVVCGVSLKSIGLGPCNSEGRLIGRLRRADSFEEVAVASACRCFDHSRFSGAGRSVSPPRQPE